jgi:hypothetical protein
MNQPTEPKRKRKTGRPAIPQHVWSLTRNWPVHNLIAHPTSEIVYWLVRPFSKRKAERWRNAIHDRTVPEHKPEYERG